MSSDTITEVLFPSSSVGEMNLDKINMGYQHTACTDLDVGCVSVGGKTKMKIALCVEG